MEDKWKEGDEAVEKLAGIFSKIAKSGKNYEEKIAEMSRELEKAAKPWDMKGDDRVLSMMTTKAGTAIEEIVNSEIDNIIKDAGSFEGKLARFKKLEAEIDKIPWLARGFKSSLRVDIALALTDLRMKRND